MPQTSFWQRRPALCALCIILLTTAVRLWFVASGQLDLVQDEAQYWDWSRRLQLSYYSKGPLIAWVIAFWTSIAGDTELGVRLGSIMHGAVAQGLLYLGMAHLFRRPQLGLLTLVVANTTPLFLAAGILSTTDSPLLVCWLICMLALHEATRRPRAVLPYALLAICMALGVLAKYMMLAAAGMALVHMALLARHKLLPQGMAWRALCAMAAGALVGMVPIVAWNMANDWVSFRHVATLAGVSGKAAQSFLQPARLPEHLGGQIGIVTPWWLAFMLWGGWRALRMAWQGNIPHDDPASTLERSEAIRQAALLAAFFWPLWGSITLWSLHTRIYPNWPGMSYAAGIMLGAWALERLLSGWGSLRARKLVPLWLTLGIALFALAHVQNMLPLPPKYNPATRLKGWADLGEKLDELRLAQPDPQKVFYFSDAYDITAELAFYAPGKPYTYCVDFGRRMSQYDIWPAPYDKTGWSALFVRRDGDDIPMQLRTMFDEAEILRYDSTHRGKPGRSFSIIVLRGFNGTWPRQTTGRY